MKPCSPRVFACALRPHIAGSQPNASSASATFGCLPIRTLAKFFLPCLFCALAIGCVERRMTIRTNVDGQGGALVSIDDQEVGYSPVSTGFTYYADREIRLIKDGHETVTLVQPIDAPWWDSLFLEFFVENLWPFTVRDDREFHYELPPTAPVSTGEVIQRGQQLRSEAYSGAEVLPGILPPGSAARVNF
jgi:hypothetical protein